MSRTQLPGLGFKGNYADGENNWGADVNLALMILSVVGRRQVASKTTALDPNAPDGAITIVPANASANAGRIAFRFLGAWGYIDPWEGARFYVTDEAFDAQYTAAGGWRSLDRTLQSVHITNSLILDGSHIGKAIVCDNAADINITINPGLQVGGQIVVKRNAAGNVTIVPAGGVTLDVPDDQTTQLDVRGSTVVLWQDTANAWDMQGRTVAKS